MAVSKGFVASRLNHELPTTLEALGEHLYIKTEHLTQELAIQTDVAKVTGMLLEAGEKEVLKMLQDEQHLRQTVLRAITLVPYVCQPPQELNNFDETGQKPHDVEDLEEALFEEVKKIEQDLSSKVTGMILEMGMLQVKSLLQSSSQLKAAVIKARETYLAHSRNMPEPLLTEDCSRGSRHERCRDECCSPISLSDEELGEIIYEEAEKLFPTQADKITGVVMEVDSKQLKSLLQDSAKLQELLRVAYAALQKGTQQC